MGVQVHRETDQEIKDMGTLGLLSERCTDCRKHTRYWTEGGAIPLCQKCAANRTT